VKLPGTRIGLHPEGAGFLSFLQVARDLQIAGKGEKELLLAMDPQQITERQWLAATELPNEAKNRESAFAIAAVLQRTRPHKVALVFNVVGSPRWFVGMFTEVEVRQILTSAQQVKPKKKEKQ